jgi:DNA adenine methylase
VNELQQRAYVEPYSGGCGLALSLLFEGHVTQVYLNDVDRSVWAFWKAAIDHTDELVALIETTPVTIEEWSNQRLVQFRKETASVTELGFSTFFLNRTNRSGIVHYGGAIGGKAQAGAWKLDCRFNKVDLIKRIKRVAQYKNRINIYNEDAEVFIDRLGVSVPGNSVVYIDPPYYEKGAELYRNAYKRSDHERIAARISAIKNPWFMTYDNVEPIRVLYSAFEIIELDIGYSVQTKRRGSEVLVVGNGLRMPVDGEATAH